MSFVYKKRLTTIDWINYVLLAIIAIISLFPFVYVFSVSFTDPESYIPLKLYLFPENWSLAAYKYILSTASFINSLMSTVFITVVGTILNLLFTLTMAYALTKKKVPGMKFMMGCVIFTLVFSAGIVPNYLLVKELGLLNSLWALILPNLTNAWSLIVVKSFIDNLPTELEEAAIIDGCNELGVFLKVILPLSMPVIAAFTLFFAVAHWNQYFQALVYLTDSEKWTLQVLVKSLVIDSEAIGAASSGAVSDDSTQPPSETIRMASIVLSMLPILIVYPFLQKHFAKGVMLGSIKG
ncbi:carbohydrate ABC transporter permease [Gracilibacillus alcaliphilus]|uniref:carbohydrate ABC transporter permease n=1 Tax=Gracilibacillus alcaliphilus TaxID=1401441 RepID=UPI001959F6A6|nr:carbohydrate ABC transporter permease [Gracilibacillus alcaliphilus]MBM7679109.1 putative aldouronate transport system permease protein [Gracilibacillus alcaliphilus]